MPIRRCLLGLVVAATGCFSDPGANPSEDDDGTTEGDETEDDETDTGDTNCVPEPPSGWTGPVAVRLGTNPDELACDPSWPIDQGAAGVGEPGGEATCGECTCTSATGATCPSSASIDRHPNDPTCANAAVETFVATETCEVLGGSVGGHLRGIALVPQPGSCESDGGGVQTLDPAFAQYAQLCELETDPPSCSGGLAIPDFADPDWTVCVYQAGELPSCPLGSYAVGPLVVADEFVDTRTCTSCGCDAPANVACSEASTSIYTGPDCNGVPSSVVVHDDSCSGASETVRAFRLQTPPTVANEGECAAVGGQASGAVEVDHNITLCCQ